MNKNQKKRIAIEVKYERVSNSSPGYHKYIVTILEPSGETKKVPAYGRDAQEALSRLNRFYLYQEASQRIEVIPTWAALLVFLVSIAPSAILVRITGNPWYFLIEFFILAVIFMLVSSITSKDEDWLNLD